MLKQELEHHVNDVIFFGQEGADYTADYRPDQEQKQVNNGAQKMDFDLSGSEPHESRHNHLRFIKDNCVLVQSKTYNWGQTYTTT